jgi:hypothetical protein
MAVSVTWPASGDVIVLKKALQNKVAIRNSCFTGISKEGES